MPSMPLYEKLYITAHHSVAALLRAGCFFVYFKATYTFLTGVCRLHAKRRRVSAIPHHCRSSFLGANKLFCNIIRQRHTNDSDLTLETCVLGFLFIAQIITDEYWSLAHVQKPTLWLTGWQPSIKSVTAHRQLGLKTWPPAPGMY